MSYAYALLFCRITIAVLFAASAIGKAMSRRDFELAISGFQLLRARRSIALTATAVLVAEAATALLVAIGGPLLVPGFLLGGLLLLAFTWVLARTLRRRIEVSCNCFGPGVRPIGPDDIVRNLVMLLCGSTGLALSRHAGDPVSTGTGLLLAGMSVVFVLTMSNLSDIATTLRAPL